MFALKLLSVCLVATLVSGEEAGNVRRKVGTNRIVGGMIIPVSKAPYIVQIRNKTDFTICGGTLVTERHVVTAAHCFDWDSPDDLSVMAGVSTRSEEAERRHIAKVFIHPKYHGLNMDNDVAVVKLDKPLVESNDTKIMQKLCSKPLQEGNSIRVSGWGRLSFRGNFSEELRTTRVPITSAEECIGKVGVSDSKICAYAPDTDACTTDSGGPGIFNEELCAIVSHGFECALRGYPGVYTSVHAVRDFIDDSLRA